jgi:aminopeptidase
MSPPQLINAAPISISGSREEALTMPDPRTSNLAKILVQHSVSVSPGDLVVLDCWGSLVAGMPLLMEVYREVIRPGGNPILHPDAAICDEFAYIRYQEASDEQLDFADTAEDLLVDRMDCSIEVMCAMNTRQLSQVDPAKRAIVRRAYADIKRRFYARAALGDLRWVLSGFPTSGFAQEAEMSLEEYQDFVYKTTFADSDDPVASWMVMEERQNRLISWLEGKDHVKIVGDGIDLEMSFKDRKFLNASGRNNMPDGEIYTSPVEESVNGTVRFSYPCIYSAIEVGGAEVTFENGKVVTAHAEKNEPYLLELLKTDEGASYLGELGIGTNDQIGRFTGNMLFDEKIGGSIHLALGLGFPEAGSKNTSGLHWDLLTDMRNGGKIFVDGDLFYDSGEFRV